MGSYARLALEACGCGDDFVYDLTDLVVGGDFSADEDLVAYSMALTANEYASSGKACWLKRLDAVQAA